MTSIFRLALGADFDRLHPAMQARFDVHSGRSCTGTGVMNRVWRGGAFTRPFLAFGAMRNILCDRVGTDVPFIIRNHSYVDSFGRETVTFARTFVFNRPHRWDATMIYSPERGCIVDYLGTHQHLAVDLHHRVDDRGGLEIRSGEYRIHEGPLRGRVPELITGQARLREWWDGERFQIRVAVVNRYFGPLFGYEGAFTVRYDESGPVPAELRPIRENALM
ncbi:DUF4166 domain-containing protein [Pseudonocardiaceae bacterium YIM PH 21723]|nr:DUF4166 domain-containing protein [Pseudonocardiaceae bacterium YIM PH 21723]